MAVTALNIRDVRVLFMTVQKPNGGVDVDIYLADENYMPQGKTSMGYAHQNEDDYHKELRLKSKEKGYYVSDFSTNSEWDPEENGGEGN